MAYRDMVSKYHNDWNNFYRKAETSSQEEIKGFLNQQKQSVDKFITAINGFETRINEQIDKYKSDN